MPAGRLRLERLLQSLLPGCRISVESAARVVLSADQTGGGGARSGGSGAVGCGRRSDGREARYGGWGWLVGDDGSGAWVTREAVREVMGRAESGRPLGELGSRLLDACGTGDPMQLPGKVHRLREPMKWAALANVVFETADLDPGAETIVLRGASALSQLAKSVRASLGIDGPIVMAGGLLLNQSKLECAVREELGPMCTRLEEPPVAGAVRLAELGLAS